MESWYVTAVLNRCPACHQGKLFEGYMKLRERCDVCDAQYERWSGLWTGPVVMGYAVGAFVALVLIAFLMATDNLVPGAEIGIALVSCAVVMATYRPVKAVYVGLLYDTGYIYADPPAAPAEPAEPAPADEPAEGPGAA